MKENIKVTLYFMAYVLLYIGLIALTHKLTTI